MGYSKIMTAAMNGRTRMKGSALGSIIIHVLAALSIPALAWTISDNPSIETVSFTKILRVQIVHPPPKPALRPRATAPEHHITPSVNFTNKVVVVKLHSSPQASHVPIATNAPAAPAVSNVAQAGAANGSGAAAPVVTPSPASRAVASENTRQVGGYLPFGAEQPTPVLDPTVRKQLDALGTHVTLVVTVGDDGHTTNVVFQPPLDPQTESKIRSLLADANWDPAVCGGGVACEAQATIKL